MKVTRLSEAERRPRNVAIGTFDGVHLGHREVIEGADTVLTFDPHPLAVLHPEGLPKLIMSFTVKRDVIAGLGVSELVVIPFDPDVAAMEPDEFVDRVLVSRLDAKRVSVGENFRFGRKARGDPSHLVARPEFETRVVPILEAAGERISSTRIRALVAAGEVEQAHELLGAPFMLEGEVVAGEERGRKLGYPTANLAPDDAVIVPGHGVYAGFANGHPSAISVGVRPTFGAGKSLLVEAHLLDTDEDLYGRVLRVAFARRLRGERWFPTVEELVAQMHDDVEATREACAAFQRT